MKRMRIETIIQSDIKFARIQRKDSIRIRPEKPKQKRREAPPSIHDTEIIHKILTILLPRLRMAPAIDAPVGFRGRRRRKTVKSGKPLLLE
jgi:hypothetical protein